MVFVIRCDASTTVGVGHVMRMLAVAQAIRRSGSRAVMVAAQMPDGLIRRLAAEQIELRRIETDNIDNIGDESDARQTRWVCQDIFADWVIVDGYRFGEAYVGALGAPDRSVAVVVDAMHETAWKCDLLVNQNPYAAAIGYPNASPTTRTLLGLRYAMLREELTDPDQSRLVDTDRSNEISNRVLITMGGGDADNVTMRCIEALGSIDSIQIRAIVGPANPHGPAIKSATSRRPDVEIVEPTDDMASHYRWADAVVSAAGGTCWEWLYAGCRGAIAALADNQLGVYESLTRTNMAYGLGVAADIRPDRLVRWLSTDPADNPRGDEAIAGPRPIVDGWGSSRIVAAMRRGIYLRHAGAKDCDLYFQWANEASTRSASLQSGTIEPSDHVAWFNRRLNSNDAVLLIAESDSDSGPVGQIRFERVLGHQYGVTTIQTGWELSFSIQSDHRGRGFGLEIIRLGIAWMIARGEPNLFATAKSNNTASRRCFERLGWRELPPGEIDVRENAVRYTNMSQDVGSP